MVLDDERFFYRTGRRSGPTLRSVEALPLRPALFAGVADLSTLRYDFPVVLSDRPGDPRWIEPLSSLIDVTLAEVAPAGGAGERFRRTILRLEREMRAIMAMASEARRAAAGSVSRGAAAASVSRGASAGSVSGGASDSQTWAPIVNLEELWRGAQERLTLAGGEPAAADVNRARAALQARGLFDGLVADCDADLPANLVGHAWQWVERRKAEQMRRRIETLRVTLENLVKADYLRSEAGRGAATLAAGVGPAHRDLFDFGAMAALLARPSGASALPAARRRRIDETLTILRDQKFFGGGLVHRFERVDEALDAWRERAPAMADLVRAMAVAELEAAGKYREARHDDYFASFESELVGDEERVVFPDYLVTLRRSASDPSGRAQVLEALAGDAPIKILLETDDPFGLGGQLATTAMGLGNVYVLQAPSAHLYAVRDQLLAAFEFGGPALISVFTGTFPGDGALPPYLVSAAALESRAFPAFAYDPSAGPGWAERLTLLDNPQPDRPWPVHALHYADERLARVDETIAFTPLDLALCEPSAARHFAVAPREHWDGLVPADGWLDGTAGSGAAPYVLAVDADGSLVRLAADEVLVREAKRVAEAWSRLVQLDALKHEKVMVVEVPASGVGPASGPASGSETSPAASGAQPEAAPAASTEAPESAAAGGAEPERNPDEPYIETWRCTTCNECTNVNSRMFAYNENRQAFIKDIGTGTYRDLVTAAESCQVAIIHPGKPRDPNEPGLDELIERAQPFL